MTTQTPAPVRPAIPAAERLIVALDLPDTAQARALVDRLDDAVQFYKVGMELFMADGCLDFIDWLREHGKRVFVDLKFFDVPATVGRAVARLSARGVDFATVHGNQGIMEAAATHKNAPLRVLAVTALTSLDQGDLEDLGFQCRIEELVLSRAHRALEAGCDGVVSSGLEVPALRAAGLHDLVVVTPGIRPVANREEDDQKRIMTPAQAIAAGADYLVVGRPIRDARDPRAAARGVQNEIQQALQLTR